MKKVILNRCYGAWSISKKAIREYKLRTGVELKSHCYEHRDDPVLIDIVEKLGSEANGNHATLHVDEVPDGYKYVVGEYAGDEFIWLRVDEARLRELIASGDADAIVSYVLATQCP